MRARVGAVLVGWVLTGCTGETVTLFDYTGGTTQGDAATDRDVVVVDGARETSNDAHAEALVDVDANAAQESSAPETGQPDADAQMDREASDRDVDGNVAPGDALSDATGEAEGDAVADAPPSVDATGEDSVAPDAPSDAAQVDVYVPPPMCPGPPTAPIREGCVYHPELYTPGRDTLNESCRMSHVSEPTYQYAYLCAADDTVNVPPPSLAGKCAVGGSSGFGIFYCCQCKP